MTPKPLLYLLLACGGAVALSACGPMESSEAFQAGDTEATQRQLQTLLNEVRAQS
jgi:hypothetical protein